ncbi:Sodium/hydrogen exchanger family-domain-containing protein [Morchella snyderi]|nr:Sodium/hydrogen exchanger family-domain-containing protein [Morchella snyderi]
MLVSLFIKEKLYIGEATVATICGIIFGPYGAGLLDPSTWGNVDQITLEASRIVLVVQCFAVGVELPKKYMERHWKSVLVLLIPVMTWGWLVTSLFIWWMIEPLTWLESLACAACVTATDPVLASSVVGKGKFARRIPKHLRDVLSAESGCNDGMAFPFIYLALYLIHYRPDATSVFQHWFCLTVLYECLFGSIYGVCIGYAGRQAIKWAESKNLIDRESFLVFYFVLALWCAGTGSMLGLDDLLVGFCAGVAFSNDGWFAQKTEESHVSNVIDLLLNLAYFVYFGSIIPWSSYNRPDWGITPWRLVVIAILVILFRRIPIMVAMKPIIPDIKTWREALFAGHFGPIGVGAIFVAILARAELETGDTTPLAVLPSPGSHNYMIIELIWPITTFLVISSIMVHGSSIAVFTLGKRINTMKITMSYTTANEEPNWLARMPRITPKTSMSIRRPDADEMNEKSENGGLFPPGTLPPPGGVSGGSSGFLLSKELLDSPAASRPASRPASIKAKRRKNWESGMGPGGPISESAIRPRGRRHEDITVAVPEQAAERGRQYGYELASPTSPLSQTPTSHTDGQSNLNAFQEGHDIIIENKEGDVVAQGRSPEREHEGVDPLDNSHLQAAGKKMMLPHDAKKEKRREDTEKTQSSIPLTMAVTDERSALHAARAESSNNGRTRKPAWAYRFDDNIIVEDEDGEVIRRYKIPKDKVKPTGTQKKKTLSDWATMFAMKKSKAGSSSAAAEEEEVDDDSDAKTVYSQSRGSHGIHFRMHDESGRKMSKQDFLHQLQKMDPHARAAMVSRSDLIGNPEEQLINALRSNATGGQQELQQVPSPQRLMSREDPSGSSTATVTSNSGFKAGVPDANAEKLGDERDEETAAERKRREAALGITAEDDSDSDDDGKFRGTPTSRTKSPGIRFADQPAVAADSTTQGNAGLTPRGSTLSWGKDVVMGSGKGKGKE